SGQQVFQLNIGGGKKGDFAARTRGLGAAMERVEPANSRQDSVALTAGGQSKTSTSAKQQAFEPSQNLQLAQLPNDDGTVEISYTLTEDTENVFLGLWNKFAFHVRTLVSEAKQTRGRHTVTWDGKDDRGNPVGPGVFICRMCTAGRNGASRLIELQGAF
ncbi:MAG TPA: FlgD immunoglobulin-like domain containing protein, partial [Pyrinomonadaceae bacterium]|nr:FlgD immunoglobulin-like domain containing protein [Pyrinomonadaceae bacterium]